MLDYLRLGCLGWSYTSALQNVQQWKGKDDQQMIAAVSLPGQRGIWRVSKHRIGCLHHSSQSSTWLSGIIAREWLVSILSPKTKCITHFWTCIPLGLYQMGWIHSLVQVFLIFCHLFQRNLPYWKIIVKSSHFYMID